MNAARNQREKLRPVVGDGRRLDPHVVRLYLLGDLRLEVDGVDAALVSLSRKAKLLLAVLAVDRRVHGRSELAGRLWPDVREDSARVSLRTALSQLRASLGRAAGTVLASAMVASRCQPRSGPTWMRSSGCWRPVSLRRRWSAARPSC